MLVDGIELVEGSKASNFTVARGSTFPSLPDEGEMYYYDNPETGLSSLYVFKAGTWTEVGAVRKVAGRDGDVVLSVSDVQGAMPSALVGVRLAGQPAKNNF